MTSTKLLILLAIFGLLQNCNSQNKSEAEIAAKKKMINEIIQNNLTNPVDSDTIEVGSVERTEAAWREILTPKEFHILREAGTEPAFANEYVNNKTEGIYYCGGCGLPVYSSKTKFHSGTGWPSFWAPINSKLIVRQPDNRFGMARIEVACAQCGSHFGHIFPNNTVPSGERHCLNSLALDFKAKDL